MTRTYRQPLLTRWSRRDRLTVLVVAVIVAFLVGTTLLLLSVGTETEAVSNKFSDSMTVTQYDSVATARSNANRSDIVLPTATVTRNGIEHQIVGIPPDSPTVLSDYSVEWRTARLPPPPDTGIKGGVERPTTRRFETDEGSVRLRVSPYTGDSVFPRSWYVGTPSTVREVGTSGAFVVEANAGDNGFARLRTDGTVTPSLFLYFLAGVREVLRVLSGVTILAAVLVLVVLYNVTRMSVRDRMTTIRVVRTTGATPRQILGLFGLRAGLLTATGVLLGYAGGVVFTRLAVNVAIYAGVSLSLSPQVTTTSLVVLLPMFGSVVAVGFFAGLLAAWPAVSGEPASLTGLKTPSGSQQTSRLGLLPNRASTTLLRWRALIPTATTLAVFALIVLLSGSLATALTPLASPSSGTVTESGAPYPMASRIDAEYASVLRSQGIEASPEILVPQLHDGQPYLARGANFSSFTTVSDARLVSGHAPRTKYEAVIGHDLATTLGIDIGDSITLGGASSPTVTRVHIVGTFDAPGVLDDQLVVPLPTAHDLSTAPGTVQFIRTDGGTPDFSGADDGAITVTGVSAPPTAEVGKPFTVTMNVQNFGQETGERRITARIGGESESVTVSPAPGERSSRRVNLTVQNPGNYTLRVGSREKRIAVYRQPPLSLDAVPNRGQPGERMLVPVLTPNGEQVSGATVEIAGTTATTNERGVATVPLPNRTGNYTIRTTKGARTVSSHVVVSEDALHPFGARVRVTPDTASMYARPTAEVVLVNPWGRTQTRTISIVTPGKTVTKNVTLPPYRTESVSVSLSSDTGKERLAPGDYTVRIVSGGDVLATDQFSIVGDERLFSTVAQNSEYAQGSGIGHAVRSVFGDLRTLLVSMAVLAGITTVGSTAATFAQSVHARRRTVAIHRATGATRRQVLRRVLADVWRISVVSILIGITAAILIGIFLERMGLLTVFGVQLSISVSAQILATVAIGSFLLANISALVVTIPFLFADPADR
ncbi:FtsX-like permease family protein [Haladaptatus caseinilyticus]|uniref:FtsX-like permease family protein n=1 Tax=Haladaptatus caseinilyticus TaxID=2993314 RepID=UPI00224ACB62|nr:FtsX-like permease family protein [Haladaptatus caseinilyticus]